MRTGNSSPARRAWLAGRIAALAAIVIAGALAIVYYSSSGAALRSSPDPSAVVARAATRATTAASSHRSATAPRPNGKAGSAAGGKAASTNAHGSHATGKSGSPGSAPGASSGHGAGSGHGASPAHGASPRTAPVHFRTLPPSAKLPTGAACARWVRRNPKPENKSANKLANHTTGQRVGAHFFSAGDSPQANKRLAKRINGRFTGTTKEILRWAACKWGINQNIVFAQAAVESWWQQGTLGDWANDPAACPRGHKLGADGQPGECPQSYGILQNRYPYEKGSWPGIGRSTAMNADTAYAIWRSCYDGYEVWLNNVPHGRTYHQGDVWGCVGRWFAGRWHTAPAQQYIARVKKYRDERIWLTPDFQQGS